MNKHDHMCYTCMFKLVLFHQVQMFESNFQEVWILKLTSYSKDSQDIYKGLDGRKSELYGFIEFFVGLNQISRLNDLVEKKYSNLSSQALGC